MSRSYLPIGAPNCSGAGETALRAFQGVQSRVQIRFNHKTALSSTEIGQGDEHGRGAGAVRDLDQSLPSTHIAHGHLPP